jgi:hypothetical protein
MVRPLDETQGPHNYMVMALARVWNDPYNGQVIIMDG